MQCVGRGPPFHCSTRERLELAQCPASSFADDSQGAAAFLWVRSLTKEIRDIQSSVQPRRCSANGVRPTHQCPAATQPITHPACSQGGSPARRLRMSGDAQSPTPTVSAGRGGRRRGRCSDEEMLMRPRWRHRAQTAGGAHRLSHPDGSHRRRKRRVVSISASRRCSSSFSSGITDCFSSCSTGQKP